MKQVYTKLVLVRSKALLLRGDFFCRGNAVLVTVLNDDLGIESLTDSTLPAKV